MVILKIPLFGYKYNEIGIQIIDRNGLGLSYLAKPKIFLCLFFIFHRKINNNYISISIK